MRHYTNEQDNKWYKDSSGASREWNDRDMLQHLCSCPDLQSRWDTRIEEAANLLTASSHEALPEISKGELKILVPECANHGGVLAVARLYERQARAFHCPFGLGRNMEASPQAVLKTLFMIDDVSNDQVLQVAIMFGGQPHSALAMKRECRRGHA